MKVVHGLTEKSPAEGPSVLSIGNFDGIHVGHQRILACVRDLASRDGLQSVVVTFDPHPLEVLHPENAPPRLTTLDQKLTLLESAGVDVAIVAQADSGLLGMEAETFVQTVIRDTLAARHLVEGGNFGFGKGRKGNVTLLAELAGRMGYSLHVMEAVQLDLPKGAQRVSSSLVRKLVAGGAVRDAARALGREYTLTGIIEPGDQRGRELGIPTANLGQLATLVPSDGVYAAWAQVDDIRHAAAVSIGTTPTFAGSERKVEAHLLDYSGDLYDKTMTVGFIDRIRDQRKFNSREELVAQIHCDISDVRNKVSLSDSSR